MDTKVCCRCKVEKPRTEFYQNIKELKPAPKSSYIPLLNELISIGYTLDILK